MLHDETTAPELPAAGLHAAVVSVLAVAGCGHVGLQDHPSDTGGNAGPAIGDADPERDMMPNDAPAGVVADNDGRSEHHEPDGAAVG